MLRDELLRSKKNELASCLLSRKRKLSELYFATVSLESPQAPAKQPASISSEQDFLNANDLAKGCYFNDATLPPRPDIAAITPPEDAEEPVKSFARPVAIRKPESPIEPTTTTVKTQARTDLPSAANGEEEGVERLTTAIQISPEEPTASAAHGATSKGSQTPSVAGDAQTESHGDPMQVDQVNSVPILERSKIETRVVSPRRTPATDPKQLASPLPDIESPSKNGGDERLAQDAEGALRERSPSRGKLLSPRKHGDAKQSSATGPASMADQASSPASTVGPYSSNTPGVPAASPDTSPDGEDRPGRHDGMELDPNRFTLSSKLPQTPDEQMPLDNTVLQPGPHGESSITNKQTLSIAQEASSSTTEKPSDAMLPPNKVARDAPQAAVSQDGSSRSIKRPNMRIDTHSKGVVESPAKPTVSLVESPMSMAISTPKRPSLVTSTAQSPPERMITRVSSGAIRHKSVSEILGETPRPTTSQPEKPASDKASGESSRAASISDSVDSQSSALIRSTLANRKEREKERSRLSTVIFAKHNQPGDGMDQTEVLQQVLGEKADVRLKDRDYLNSLFEARAYSPPRAMQLTALLASAHKSLSTSDHMVEYMEQTNCRTLRRIYQLQNANRWPLRQMERQAEPERPTSHWDFLLDHMKWMRTDFREERKWKMAAARGCAEWCAEYVASGPSQRELLRVKTKPPKILPEDHMPPDVDMKDVGHDDVEQSQPTPDLVPSAEDESVDEGSIGEPFNDLRMSNAPAAIFSLGPTDFNFPFTKTPSAEKILNELPLYQPARIEPDLAHSDLAQRLDARWKKDILPISKFATGKIRMTSSKPPRKRSRYDYESEDEVENENAPVEPEQTDVALFLPEYKPLRERIHPGNSFRPPTDHPMPTQAFFESRSSSQWTQADDDQLRSLVREYSYNWSLISSLLSSPSQYHSGADRRTSWECFERWLSLEGLPSDMSKIPYFKTYHARIEAAGQKVMAQLQAAQAQAPPGANLRRRTTQPIRVERKRNTKYLALLDAMRKLAKKREAAIQKQQHSASMSAMRKTNEATQPRPRISTPAEFSQLKYERDQKLLERQEAYRQQVLASQRATQIQRAQLANAYPNGGQARNANGVVANGSSPIAGASIPANLPNGQPQAGNQARAQATMQALPNSVQPNGTHPHIAGMKGLAPGQIPPTMQRMPMNSPESQRVLYEAQRLTAEQQQRVLAQQRSMAQQGHNQPNGGPQSSPNLPMATMNGTSPPNPAMLAAMQAASGMASPGPNANSNNNGNSSSPRIGQAQALSSGVTPAINSLAAQISVQRPDLTPEQVQAQATSRLMQLHAQQQQRERRMNQAALNAAAGAQNAGAINANFSHDGSNNVGQRGPMMTNEQVRAYNNYMRQQHDQAMRSVTGGNMGMNGSPVMNGANLARAVGANGGSRSSTPQQGRSGSVSGGGQSNGAPQGGQSKSPRTQAATAQ